MSPPRASLLAAIFLGAVAPGPPWPATSSAPRAAAAQEAPARPGPWLLLHDWFGKSPASTPAYIRDHLTFLESQPFDGLAIYLRSPDLSVNVTTSVLSDAPLTVEAIEEVLRPLAGLPLGSLMHNFAAVVSVRPPDLFDDWTVVVRNFGFLAKAARGAGLEGIYFDNENYGAKWANYPSGVAQPRKSLAEYQVQARLRGRQLMEAMVAAFPEIVVLTLHGPYVSESKAPSPLFPAWQNYGRLLGPFFAGFVEGAGDRSVVVDGGELYHLRKEDDFRRSYDWRKKTFASDEIDCAYLTPAVRASYASRVEIAFGVYDRPYGGLPMDPPTMARVIAAALRRTDRYVWLYVEGRSYLEPPDRGGSEAEWVLAVRRGRDEGRLRPR